jgi:hypothetical protein
MMMTVEWWTGDEQSRSHGEIIPKSGRRSFLRDRGQGDEISLFLLSFQEKM